MFQPQKGQILLTADHTKINVIFISFGVRKKQNNLAERVAYNAKSLFISRSKNVENPSFGHR